MPTIKNRKLINLGGCKVVTLPVDWLRWVKQRYGVDLREVILETDDNITIKPKLSKREREGATDFNERNR